MVCVLAFRLFNYGMPRSDDGRCGGAAGWMIVPIPAIAKQALSIYLLMQVKGAGPIGL